MIFVSNGNYNLNGFGKQKDIFYTEYITFLWYGV